jgi:probable addiction module antidote protein
MKPAVSYRKELMTLLKDPGEASAYLNAALEAGDKKAFLLALRNVLEAQGGMTAFAQRTKINRVSLYKMLSDKGNPGFENILFLLHAAGVTFQTAPHVVKKNLRKAA